MVKIWTAQTFCHEFPIVKDFQELPTNIYELHKLITIQLQIIKFINS